MKQLISHAYVFHSNDKSDQTAHGSSAEENIVMFWKYSHHNSDLVLFILGSMDSYSFAQMIPFISQTLVCIFNKQCWDGVRQLVFGFGHHNEKLYVFCYCTLLLASFSLWNLYFYKCHFCVCIFLYFTQDICWDLPLEIYETRLFRGHFLN